MSRQENKADKFLKTAFLASIRLMFESDKFTKIKIKQKRCTHLNRFRQNTINLDYFNKKIYNR